jgi:Zn-dependent metalloprotease
MISLLLAATLGPGAPADFKAAFPAASIIESPAGGRLTHVSGFEAPGLGDTPEAAARAFLAKYGTAFGINLRQQLVARGTPAPGQAAAVRFERRIDGSPVFDADVVVGVNAAYAVILVNSTDIPGEVKGRARISRRAAIRAAKVAIPGLETSDVPRTERGWRAVGHVIRPVWRVDFTAARPPGDWRTYVDAEAGKVLLRVDLRANASGLGVAPIRGSLEQPTPRR